MAWEAAGLDISLPCATTGLAQYRFVNVSTAGRLIYPVVNGAVVGVLQTGSTGSTEEPGALTVRVAGVTKVSQAASSTIGVGETVAATSVGSCGAAAAASYAVGRVIAGTSGGASRVLTVLINPVAGSTALA